MEAKGIQNAAATFQLCRFANNNWETVEEERNDDEARLFIPFSKLDDEFGIHLFLAVGNQRSFVVYTVYICKR